MRIVIYFLISFYFTGSAKAQLKFLVEDFEGFVDGQTSLQDNGIFNFGYIKASIDSKVHNKPGGYAGQKALKLQRSDKFTYGGWGKGVGLNIQLDEEQDNLNFYVLFPAVNSTKTSNAIKIELQEDDNNDNVFQKDKDDSWTYSLTIQNSVGDKNENLWELISIQLNKFKDANPGGDGVLNINYRQGKLFTIIISFIGENSFAAKQECYFDFICFSKGKLPTGSGSFDPPQAAKNDLCNLGAWSIEGNSANFVEIAHVFEKNFAPSSDKKLGVIHFFQPFSLDNGKISHYPSVEKINEVITAGYIPMITLENHFVNGDPNIKQPNLYSITEGHFDSFFGYWASQIKQVKGTVLLRILHEFNGDWYPWCTINNDKNPQLLGKAFRYIHNIFKENNVNNVKFIWCPNSMSIPQESWNYIMDAYPGDDYVDYVGLDIYNGAGKSIVWRSFRKEGIENYFELTEKLPSKPLLICEAASREKSRNEAKSLADKAEWIKQMSETLKSDMSKVRLLAWFNEKETFKINSSGEAKNAYLDYIMKDEYFKSGTENIYPMLNH